MNQSLRFCLSCCAVLWWHAPLLAQPNRPASALSPNIVIIYADDLGYGDVSTYFPKNRLKTPEMDNLSRQGLRFTRAYCTGATCTPSRYSLLTGTYPWRKTGTGVLPGDASAIIRSGQPTLASVCQSAGYVTGAVGKWHLGLGDERGGDWNGTISQSPNDVGFNYSFIMAATGDRVPTVYVENSRVVNLDPADPIQVNYKQKIGTDPTGKEHPDRLKMGLTHGHDNTIVNGISRIGWMTGGNNARWTDEDMADQFTQKALAFIETNKARPFMLYFAPHDVHVPRVPHPRFVGKSGLGPRGDALLELDWSVGEVVKTLEKHGLTRNTLVILSSDNGPVLNDGYRDEAVEKLGSHKPAGPLRGGKYSIFEAGTRIPFIVRYPARVKPGVSSALVSQVDLVATVAALVGQPAPAEATDSQNHLDVLLGLDRTGRTDVVVHTQVGNLFAIMDGRWKYIEPNPTAGAFLKDTQTETGANAAPQLYDLTRDPAETTNVANRHPDVVQRLANRINELKRNKQQ
jgi:arylsulfatase A-like enzyme